MSERREGGNKNGMINLAYRLNRANVFSFSNYSKHWFI